MPEHESMTAPTQAAPRDGQLGTFDRSLIWSALIAILSGVLSAVDGPEPTGAPVADAVLVVLSVALVAWLGGAIPHWMAIGAPLVAGVTTASSVNIVVGTLTSVSALVRDRWLELRAGDDAGAGERIADERFQTALVGAAMILLTHSQLDWFHGSSTIVGVGVGIVIGVSGLVRRSRVTQRTLIIGSAAVFSAAVIGVAVFAFGALAAADDLRNGKALAERGLAQLSDGEIGAARESFIAASSMFADAEERLDTPWSATARYVPIAAQHRRAATDLSTEAAAATRVLGDELTRVDLSALSIANGRIDLDEIRALDRSLSEIQGSIAQLGQTLVDVRSPWLIGAVDELLDELSAELDEQQTRGEDVLDIVRAAPALLGSDGPRVYFIGFMTQSEARGLGGLMGNYAQVTLNDGRVELSDFGRSDDLIDDADPNQTRVTGLDGWLQRYGRFGLDTGPSGSDHPFQWKNVTMSPDMASTGSAIAQMYPQSGGEPVDGVFMIDVYTLARFLDFTGPVELAGAGPDGTPLTVTADDAPEFLLHAQYTDFEKAERIDTLETLSRSVVEQLLAGGIPSPLDLADSLGPMVDEGRLLGYAVRPDEQALLEQVGLGGTMVRPRSNDGIGVTFNNAGGNKIDYFLRAAATYAVDAHESSGSAEGTLELTITNTAPTSGQPSYVIGNSVDLPEGTNRTYVSVFSRLRASDASIDGEPLRVEFEQESGYYVTSAFIDIAAGETRTVAMRLSGPIDLADGYVLQVRSPPLVRDAPFAIDATLHSLEGEEHSSAVTIEDAGTTLVTVETPQR
jgi:hypothetical protein